MSSSLLLQQCFACFVHFTWKPCEMGDKCLRAPEFIRFKQEGAISTLSSTHLKIVPQFTCFNRNISSTEIYVNIRLAKTWATINRLSIKWKFDLSNEIKQDFFRAVSDSILTLRCTIWTLKKHTEKNLAGNYTRILPAILNKSWNQHFQNSRCTTNLFINT